MSDKTEEQIAAEKAAVAAMRNAKANMETAFDRIDTLTRALANAATFIESAKKYVPENAWRYRSEERLSTAFDEAAAAARAALG